MSLLFIYNSINVDFASLLYPYIFISISCIIFGCIIDHLFGARVHFFPQTKINRNLEMKNLAAKLTTQGRKVYIIPVGGSNAVGSLGYVQCAYELKQQCRLGPKGLEKLNNPLEPITVACATSSYGSVAGLVVGFCLLNQQVSNNPIATAPRFNVLVCMHTHYIHTCIYVHLYTDHNIP